MERGVNKINDRDFVAGVTLIVSAVIVYFLAAQFPEALSGEMGAAFYPGLCAMVMGACGIGLALQGWKRNVKNPVPVFVWGKLIPMLLILAFYAITLRFLGFRISTIIFVFICMFFLGERKPMLLASIPIGVSLGIYYLFVKVFLIILP
jgi:putative tricarboxylic transport membrane protein